MTDLFSPLKIRGVTPRNRIGVSPMCQYSSEDGRANDWHLVHLGVRSVGGAGLIIAEATAVTPEGRITPHDAGIWADDQIEPLLRVNQFISTFGAVPAVQLAHAGRKAGAARPWQGGGHLDDADGGWTPKGPTDEPFGGRLPKKPDAMTVEEIQGVVQAFADGAKRSIEAGYQIIEIHGAHGYLQHSFYSPLSNTRTDEYGGSFPNRIRLMRETVAAVRAVIPDNMPLFVRLSASDWDSNGWSLEDSVALAEILRDEGVDCIDCSSGGASAASKTALSGVKRDQIPLAAGVREHADILTAAVGGIQDPVAANEIINLGQADIVLLGRQYLRDPYWPYHAAQVLGVSAEDVLPERVAFWIK